MMSSWHRICEAVKELYLIIFTDKGIKKEPDRRDDYFLMEDVSEAETATAFVPVINMNRKQKHKKCNLGDFKTNFSYFAYHTSLLSTVNATERQLLVDKVIVPILHSTPISTNSIKLSNKPISVLDEDDWIAILFQEFKNQVITLSMSENPKETQETYSWLDPPMVELIRAMFSLSASDDLKSVCSVLNKLSFIGLFADNHLQTWNYISSRKQSSIDLLITAIEENGKEKILEEIRNFREKVNEKHQILLNALLWLFDWDSCQARNRSMKSESFTNQSNAASYLDLSFSEKSKARVMKSVLNKLITRHGSCKKISIADRIHSPRGRAIMSFDEKEWLVILFEEFRNRFLQECISMKCDRASFFDKEDIGLLMFDAEYQKLINNVFPDVKMTGSNLRNVSKILTGLSRLTLFRYKRDLVLWHHTWKSHAHVLARYNKFRTNYALLQNEMNSLDININEPLRILLDCVLLLS